MNTDNCHQTASAGKWMDSFICIRCLFSTWSHLKGIIHIHWKIYSWECTLGIFKSYLLGSICSEISSWLHPCQNNQKSPQGKCIIVVRLCSGMGARKFNFSVLISLTTKTFVVHHVWTYDWLFGKRVLTYMGKGSDIFNWCKYTPKVAFECYTFFERWGLDLSKNI